MNDLISRQAAIDALLGITKFKTRRELVNRCDASIADSEGWLGGVAECIDEIDDLPSVQPEEDTIEMQEADIDETMKRLRDARVTIPLSVQPVLSDCISRQAAIDYIDRAITAWSEDKEIAIDCLRNLPSAEPSSKRAWYQKGYRDGQKEAESTIRLLQSREENR